MKIFNNSINRIAIIVFLSSILISCANSGENQNHSTGDNNFIHRQEKKRIIGEYIVIVKNNCDEFKLQKFFYEYGILNIRLIEDNKYLIKFANDPGLKELTREARKTNAIKEIQPGYLVNKKTSDNK